MPNLSRPTTPARPLTPQQRTSANLYRFEPPPGQWRFEPYQRRPLFPSVHQQVANARPASASMHGRPASALPHGRPTSASPKTAPRSPYESMGYARPGTFLVPKAKTYSFTPLKIPDHVRNPGRPRSAQPRMMRGREVDAIDMGGDGTSKKYMTDGATSLYDITSKFDADGDGVLTRAEFLAGIKSDAVKML